MLLVALTGGIGCGKSTAVKYFRSHGVLLIDADEIARQIVEPGKPAYKKLRGEFGSDYFDDENGGRLIREKLGDLVFNNPEVRLKLIMKIFILRNAASSTVLRIQKSAVKSSFKLSEPSLPVKSMWLLTFRCCSKAVLTGSSKRSSSFTGKSMLGIHKKISASFKLPDLNLLNAKISLFIWHMLSNVS
jgi:hypothetical protein